ncbi:MAG: N-acetyltransferase [Candidatus Pelethousia sp.]|nr:N-acetyltransferase [Candidatus Pelethousia sp.]
MDIQLRREQPMDYRETENLTREAFWNQYAPGCDEHYLAHILRGSPAFVPELDAVALLDGKIVGNIMYMRALIQGDNGSEYEVLCLGPISVLPAYQRQGIGAKLIEHTRNLAREMGFRAIFLCGDPAYYSRQGFVAAESFGVRTAENMYAVALQGCELYPGALAGASGRYYENEVYNVDKQASAAFDQSFPPKALLSGTPSQRRFQEIVVLQRPAD